MKGFTFFENYYNAISDPDSNLSDEEIGRLYNAIFAYVFRGEEPELKGASKAIFTLMRVSLDRSKRNGENRSNSGRNQNPNGNEMETQSNPNGNEMETQSNPNGNEMESQNPPFFEEEEKEEDNCYVTLQNAGAGARVRVAEGRTPEDMKRFFDDHPEIRVDIASSELSFIDWPLFARKISESRLLKTKKSLHWLVRHYNEIIGDSYKDFPTGNPSEQSEQEETARKKAEFLKNHPWMEE